MDFLQSHIEALIFSANEPISEEEIRACLSEMLETEVPLEDINLALEQLQRKYEQGIFAFSIQTVAGGYQFFTKAEYQASIAILLKQKSKKRLTRAALETLAIVAYKQPVTKSQLEQVRGVNCDYAIQKLLDKELVMIQGKAKTVGNPLLYGTTDKFMEYFGLNSLEDLPLPKDFSREGLESELDEIEETNNTNLETTDNSIENSETE